MTNHAKPNGIPPSDTSPAPPAQIGVRTGIIDGKPATEVIDAATQRVVLRLDPVGLATLNAILANELAGLLARAQPAPSRIIVPPPPGMRVN